MADSGLREPLRVPGRHREPGGLLQAGLGEDHLPGELAEFRLGLGPQPGLGEHRRDQFGGVAGLAQRRGEAEGLVLAVRAQRRQQLPALGGEDRGDVFLRCVSHAIQRSSAPPARCDGTAGDRLDGMEDSGTGDSTSADTAGQDDAGRDATWQYDAGQDTDGQDDAGQERPSPQGLARYARPALIAGAVIAVVCIALLVIIFFLDSFNATVYSVGGKNVQDATDEARAIRDSYAAARLGGIIFLIAGVLLAAAGAAAAVPAPE